MRLMSSTSVAGLVVLATLAGLLALSGVAKLRDPRATRDAVDALRVPAVVPRDLTARVLPWLEIALALLLLAPAPVVAPAAVAVTVLLLAYTGVVARALGFDEPVTCSCFGALGRHDVDRTTLARNVLLTALGGAALWFALAGGSAGRALAEGGSDAVATLLATTAAVAVTALVIDRGPSGEPSAEEDYERRPIPYGVVRDQEGRTATLVELAASQARLLVMLSPGCTPCVRTAAHLDGWAERLDPVVGVLAVYLREPDHVEELGHRPDLAVVEPDFNVRRVLGLGSPSAVLLGADGLLAGGPVSGEDAVREFVADVVAEIESDPHTLPRPGS